MAVEQLITEHIDLWTSAIKPRNTQGRGSSKKRELYGIKKLRELILELAVRGKLLPQNLSDEPASVLLERVAAEKVQLVREKKIKKPKKLPEISDYELLFELPRGWAWLRLNDLGEWGAGATPSRGNSEYYGGNIPWFKSGELSQDYIFESEETVTEKALKDSSLRYNSVGDVLIAMYGATIGKTSILAVPATTNQAVCACTPFTGISNRYLLTYLKAYRAHFSGMGAGGAQPNISREKIIATVIGLPPENEQHRIVAKVDELMALCDQLEQQTEASIDAHQLLVDTLLATLTDAKDATELSESWARLMATDDLYVGSIGAISGGANHDSDAPPSVFDILFTTDYAIEQLKQTILQLAVMGKLVPQDPTHAPASELLNRIAAEKEQLIKDKKIKKQQPLPKITAENKPFELPGGWEWCNLSDVQALVTDGDHQAPPKSSSGIPFLVIGNLNTGAVNFEGCNYVPKEYYLALDWGRRPSIGDMLYTVTGSYGIPVKIDSDEQFCVQRHVAILKSTQSTPVAYLNYALKSKLAFDYAGKIATGIAQKTVPLTGLRKMPIPLPPLSEQQSIVAITNQLMALCNQLKTRLNEAQTTQLYLADAAAHEVIGEPVRNTEDAEVNIQVMKITTTLSLDCNEFEEDAVIAPVIRELGGSADAKDVWSKTQMSLPDFYAQLKIEIEAQYIAMPARADF